MINWEWLQSNEVRDYLFVKWQRIPKSTQWDARMLLGFLTMALSIYGFIRITITVVAIVVWLTKRLFVPLFLAIFAYCLASLYLAVSQSKYLDPFWVSLVDHTLHIVR